MKFKLALIFLFSIFQLSASAQETYNLKVYDHKKLEGQTLKVFSENGLIAITVYDANIIKVSYLKYQSQDTDFSFATIAQPKKTNIRVTQNLDDIFLTTDSLIVTINKLNFVIRFLDNHQDTLATNLSAIETADSVKTLNFKVKNEESLNGFELNNKAWNEKIISNLKSPLSVPFLVSDIGYGIFFDNKDFTSLTGLKDETSKLQFSTKTGNLSYFFFSGNQQEIIKNYTWLIGRQSLPPIRALGYLPNEKIMEKPLILREEKNINNLSIYHQLEKSADANSNERNFSPTSNYLAGMQRYGIYPILNIDYSDWKSLKAQIPKLINAGISGIAYPKLSLNNPISDPELYLRWFQLETFSPIFSLDSFSKKNSLVQESSKKYIQLRNSLLPYNYSLAAENINSGRPLVLSLNYFSSEGKLKNIDDEYLWGENILVAPILEKGATTKKVIFPKGTWINYYSGKSYQDSTSVKAEITHLPIFAKAGSFIITSPNIQNTIEYNSEELLIKYFLQKDSLRHKTRMFYDDGNDPKSIKKGAYEVLTFIGYGDNLLHTIETASTKPGKKRYLTYEIFNVKKPKKIYTSEGKIIKLKNTRTLKENGFANYDRKTKLLNLHLIDNGQPLKIHFIGL